MRSLSSLARGAVAGLTMLVLVACTGGSAYVCHPLPIPSPPPLPVLTLISPASGATGVSTGPLDVTIGNAATATGMYLKDGNGNFVAVTNFRPANASSNDVAVATFAQLASQTTYQVFALVTAPASNFYNICGPAPGPQPGAIALTQPELLGSFTTR
jgi:hypothetical protein